MPKILEFKGNDLMKGLSLQRSHPVGGLWQFGQFDPFEKMGIAYPSLAPVERGSGVLSTTINQIIPYRNSGSKAFLFSDGVAGSTGVYTIDLSTGTVTDISAEFHAGSVGAVRVPGSTLYKNRVIYVNSDGNVKSNTLTPASGNDTNLLTGLTIGFTPIPFCLAEGDLYFGNIAQVGKITNEAGTSGNSSNVHALPTGFRIVDLEFDGDNLVIVADENAIASAGTYPTDDVITRCQVRYWNRTSGTATRIWDIPEAYLIGAAMLNGVTHVFGSTGIWVCTVNESPKLLYSFTGGTITRRPMSPYQITTGRNSIYWISETDVDQRVYAYGSPVPGAQKIFYTPYAVHGSTYIGKALAYCGESFLASTSSNKVYQLNSGSTRNGVGIQNASVTLQQPHSLEAIRVTLFENMVSGDTVTVQVSSNDGANIVSDGQTIGYSNIGAKKTLLFPRKALNNNKNIFEDIAVLVTTEQNAAVEKIEVFATPVDEKLVY